MVMIPRGKPNQQQPGRVSAGLYRNAAGKLVTAQQFKQPTTTAPTTNTVGAQFGTLTAQQQKNNAAHGNSLGRYWKEYNNQNTSDARRNKIASAWGFTGYKPPTTTTTTPTGGAEPNPNGQDNAQTSEFRSYMDFMPKDVTASPEYQWRLGESQRVLDSKLAAEGLGHSGEAVRQDLGLVNQLTGEETSKAQQNALTEAARYSTQQENQAGRAERMGQNQTDNVMNFLKLQLSQNPIDQAFSGLGNYLKTLQQQAGSQASTTASNYNRTSGGGGGVAPMYTPPFQPTSSSPANIYGTGAGTSNTSNWLNTFASIMGMFGGK